MKTFDFLLPTRIVFGNSVIKKVGQKAKKLGRLALLETYKKSPAWRNLRRAKGNRLRFHLDTQTRFSYVFPN